MQKITLTVMDRLQINSVLPKTGGFIDMELAGGIKTKVQFSSKEIGEYELKDSNEGSITWNMQKAVPRAFSFEDVEIALLKKGADLLDKSQMITEGNLPLVKTLKGLS